MGPNAITIFFLTPFGQMSIAAKSVCGRPERLRWKNDLIDLHQVNDGQKARPVAKRAENGFS
jgi:hypothetical protein